MLAVGRFVDGNERDALDQEGHLQGVIGIRSIEFQSAGVARGWNLMVIRVERRRVYHVLPHIPSTDHAEE